VTSVAIALMLLLYGTVALTMAVAIVVTPLYLVFELGRYLRGLAKRRVAVARPTLAERDRATLELREQYAVGTLTMRGLEERVAEVLHAESHLEVASVFDDLPRRRFTLRGAAAFDVCAGVALLLVAHSTFALAVGALLSLGALVPLRGRAPVYAFLAGVALLALPLASVPLTASAVCRWLDEGTT
jgi:hypothetical protein